MGSGLVGGRRHSSRRDFSRRRFGVRRRRLLEAGLAASVVILASCAAVPTVVAPADLPRPLPAELESLEAAGPYETVVEVATVRSNWGCRVTYEIHSPASDLPGPQERPTVVLAHGFMRSLERMRGWAELWASHGVRTVAVSFCNSTPFNGRHDRNAEDLLLVARHVAGPTIPVTYAGFSAGGLSALLAATADPRAVAYLGLDPVHDAAAASGGLAAGAAPPDALRLFLFAEPSRCNAMNNMVPLATGGLVLRVPFATHCDFENPYDRSCERVCGVIEPAEAREEVRGTIRALATAWILAATAGQDGTWSADVGSPSAAWPFDAPGIETLERLARVRVIGP